MGVGHIFRLSFILIAAAFPRAGVAGDYDINFGGTSNAKCYLSGTVRPINSEHGKKGFQSLENRIRMNFDADDAPTCERFLRSYCQNNLIARGDIPLKLTAYFRPNRAPASKEEKQELQPTHSYQILESCKIIVE